jgi:hypothetical protein
MPLQNYLRSSFPIHRYFPPKYPRLSLSDSLSLGFTSYSGFLILPCLHLPFHLSLLNSLHPQISSKFSLLHQSSFPCYFGCGDGKSTVAGDHHGWAWRLCFGIWLVWRWSWLGGGWGSCWHGGRHPRAQPRATNHAKSGGSPVAKFSRDFGVFAAGGLRREWPGFSGFGKTHQVIDRSNFMIATDEVTFCFFSGNALVLGFTTLRRLRRLRRTLPRFVGRFLSGFA